MALMERILSQRPLLFHRERASVGQCHLFTVASNAAGRRTNSDGSQFRQATSPQASPVRPIKPWCNHNATFTASVSGLPIPTLQWRGNGVDIPRDHGIR